ncbi:FAD binding domain-containing protein [Phenylobacterium parvum]|uniref:Xanthine dehydrogenase n=1 Tax=Phenylobacterium parvum TaxID=2201350 RepID=A0A2Z3HNF9_9CAUL|nr:xanthine dehydrogenase family protein subunit M [Phenylobacterium parvum]AWM76802.1 xanthine dehydrogenase [Phenylobacterium parvum]
MKPFAYERARDVDHALSLVAASPGARFLAGGTNLLDLMKLEIEQPPRLIDVGRLRLADIAETAGGGLRIGALASNTAVASDPRVRRRYPALARAILAGGSVQLRNKATVGGNLMQRTRCPYFMDAAKPCNKRLPGSGCSAMDGLSSTLALFGASEMCIAVSPSDMSVALAAFDAVAETVRADGSVQRRPVETLHRLPDEAPQVDTDLAPDELILAVELPPPPEGGQAWRKVRARASYTGALASVAVAGDRVALGAVAARPWRARTAETALADGASPAEAVGAELAAAVGQAGRKSLVRRLAADVIRQAREGVGS